MDDEEKIKELVERLRKNFADKMPVWTIQGEAADAIEWLLNRSKNCDAPLD